MVSLRWHMVSHMVMSMVAPILLALSSPMTLALRYRPPTVPPRCSGVAGLGHAHPVAKFVTHPLWALFVFTIGLYGLYYTSLFSWLMTSHIGHVAMQLHFLAAGYLFSWSSSRTDPLCPGPARTGSD